MKVGIYFATGFEEIEALASVDTLRRAQIEVVMVGVTGKTVKSARGISVNMDTTIDDFDYEEMDMLMLPGGVPGVPNLEKNEKVIRSLKEFKKQNKWLAAICAAPSILGKLGLLENEKATCYPGYEKDLLKANFTGERVVVSHKTITGIGAGASIEFGLKLVEVLKGQAEAERIKAGMLAK